ncbi:MAG: quinoprotein dehydrogenase-associated putative ABC transporter substrate-binding protein [Gammaproteobacteria bacterium]
MKKIITTLVLVVVAVMLFKTLSKTEEVVETTEVSAEKKAAEMDSAKADVPEQDVVAKTSAPVEEVKTDVAQSSNAEGVNKPTRFKVCADPFSLPSSNKNQEGYENKIAKLFADDLGVPLEFEWFPQRIGFIRNTLRSDETDDGTYKCDIVMGTIENFEMAATTKPYLHSSWAMVYVKGRGLDEIKSQEDLMNISPELKEKLRIGLFDRSPAADWLHTYGLMLNAKPYQIMMGDARAYPGQIIEQDLVEDKINMTFVWGPIAGYFAKAIKDHEIVVIPMKSEPGIRFNYKIAMAVRFGEKEWKEQINQLIDKNQDEIDKILTEYGVPLLKL